jgi:hypothetical protein
MTAPSLRKADQSGIRWSVAAWLFLTLPASSPAQAAGKEAKERAARKACLSGNVEKGVEILSDLFVNSGGDPNYLYNQARCYEQNHRWEDAISRFLEYLRKAPHLEDADRAETEKHIADCRAYLGISPSKAPVAETQRVPVPVAADPPPPPNVPPPTITVQSTQAAPSTTPGSGLRAAGIVTAAVGGAAIITGVILNFKVNSMSSDLEKNWVPSTNSSRESYKTIGWIGYGVGSACVASGAILYYLGWHKSNSAIESVSLVPVAAGGQVGVSLGGIF